MFTKKYRLFPLVLILGFACRGDAPQETASLVGVWKLISTTPPLADGSFESSESDWQMMKIFTKSHFMFSEQAPGRLKLTSGDDDQQLCEAAKNFFGGAGRYTFDGKTLTEHIDIFMNPNYEGLSVTYECEFVQDDVWTQKGTLPVKSLGLGDEDYDIYEVWQRVE